MDAPRRRFLKLTLDRPHRYRRYRAATMAVTFAVLFGVPLFGLARMDLWGGQHLALSRPATAVEAFAAVTAAIAAFYTVTFLVNLPAGRMFCGFGCPIGQLSRFADAIDASADDLRWRRWAQLIAFGLALTVAVTLWWVAPRAFVTDRDALAVWAVVAAVTGVTVLHGRRWRWGFCRKLCPIGLYYSVVQTTPLIAVDFDPALTCIDCDGCARVCPVELDPRHLDAPVSSPGGLALDGFPGVNHCLHCGACVEVCEHVTRKFPGRAAMGFWRLKTLRAGGNTPSS